jgi:hypothetical protein
LRLYLSTDPKKRGGYIEDHGAVGDNGLEGWRLATGWERIWWEMFHARFSLFDWGLLIGIVVVYLQLTR